MYITSVCPIRREYGVTKNNINSIIWCVSNQVASCETNTKGLLPGYIIVYIVPATERRGRFGEKRIHCIILCDIKKIEIL